MNRIQLFWFFFTFALLFFFLVLVINDMWSKRFKKYGNNQNVWGFETPAMTKSHASSVSPRFIFWSRAFFHWSRVPLSLYHTECFPGLSFHLLPTSFWRFAWLSVFLLLVSRPISCLDWVHLFLIIPLPCVHLGKFPIQPQPTHLPFWVIVLEGFTAHFHIKLVGLEQHSCVSNHT